MTYKESQEIARRKHLVPDDLFERHYIRARKSDQSSRRDQFTATAADNDDRWQRRRNIRPMTGK